jgi:hypothetical protein
MIEMRNLVLRLGAGLCLSLPALAQFDPHSPLAHAHGAHSDPGLPYLDARHDEQGIPLARARAAVEAGREGAQGARRMAAIESLRARIPGLRIDEDGVLGTPNWVASTQALLTRPVAGDFQAAAIARGFLAQHQDLFEIDAAELERARVSREYRTQHNGVHHFTWQQQIDGIDLFGCEVRAHVSRHGELINLSSTMLPRPSGDFQVSERSLTAQEALVRAAVHLGIDLHTGFTARQEPEGAAARQSWFSGDFRSDIEVTSEQVYFALTRDDIRSGWALTLPVKGLGHTYDVIVDASTGAILRRHNRLVFLMGGNEPLTVRAYTTDSPAPGSPGTPAPNGFQFPFVARSLITVTGAEVSAFSPNGWINDGVNETLGNNVDAHTDLDNNNLPDLPRPVGSPYRVFDFPQDNAQEPTTYRPAAVANFFYLANRYHDKLYQLGFDEAAGNFQTLNFTGQGAGNDAVQADCQDGGGTNNANFGTSGSDGSSARCQMYVWNGPTPDRDGSLDADIVYHELTHGTSIRLHGGLSGTQPQGMGEGWSDFFGRALNATADEDVNATYQTGGYSVLSLGAGFADNYYFGIRRFPYSTDLNKAPQTFADLDPNQQSFPASVPRSTLIGNTATAVHNVGETWCNSLLECRANMITALGFGANDTFLQLVVDGMKIAPGNPTFLQSRDAILQSDLVNNAGANLSYLWAGFAKRGMGNSASSPASSTTVGIVEAFDIPNLVLIQFPGGFPAQLLPNQAAAFAMSATGLGTSQPTPNTGKLYLSVNGGAFVESALPSPSTNNYTVTLPASACLSTLRWRVSVNSPQGLVWSPSATGFQTAQVFSSSATLALDEFETNQGWTVGGAGDTATTGIWERADPEGTAAQPADDHTPAPGTLCFVTGAAAGSGVGSFDVDGGFTILTSPAYDLSANPEAKISYWRWYSNSAGSSPNADTFRVEISNAIGGAWTNVETVGPAGSEVNGGWFFKQFRVADFVTPSSMVRVRFIADDAGSGSVVEAAVDDFRIESLVCASQLTPYCFGDGSGTACPCANLGGPGSGCANSTGVGGSLSGTGTASVAGDSVVITTSGTPGTATVVFFQGVNQDNGGAGIALFDGLRCTSGTIVRLGVKASVGGTASYPQAGDQSISVRGLIPAAGATRYYQAQYRDNSSFCTSATSNFTNGLTIPWAP